MRFQKGHLIKHDSIESFNKRFLVTSAVGSFLVLASSIIMLYAMLAIGSSAIKAVMGDCEKTYNIEKALYSNLFCPNTSVLSED